MNELKKLLGASTDQSEITPFNEDEKDLEKIKAIIIQGEKTIQIKQRQDIKDAVRLGLWLDKLAKLYYSNFNTFVKDNLQFGPRWVRRLRLITRVFCKYKQLQNLSISMSVAARIVLERPFLAPSCLRACTKKATESERASPPFHTGSVVTKGPKGATGL